MTLHMILHNIIIQSFRDLSPLHVKSSQKSVNSVEDTALDWYYMREIYFYFSTELNAALQWWDLEGHLQRGRQRKSS